MLFGVLFCQRYIHNVNKKGMHVSIRCVVIMITNFNLFDINDNYCCCFCFLEDYLKHLPKDSEESKDTESK